MIGAFSLEVAELIAHTLAGMPLRAGLRRARRAGLGRADAGRPLHRVRCASRAHRSSSSGRRRIMGCGAATPARACRRRCPTQRARVAGGARRAKIADRTATVCCWVAALALEVAGGSREPREGIERRRGGHRQRRRRARARSPGGASPGAGMSGDFLSRWRPAAGSGPARRGRLPAGGAAGTRHGHPAAAAAAPAGRWLRSHRGAEAPLAGGRATAGTGRGCGSARRRPMRARARPQYRSSPSPRRFDGSLDHLRTAAQALAAAARAGDAQGFPGGPLPGHRGARGRGGRCARDPQDAVPRPRSRHWCGRRARCSLSCCWRRSTRRTSSGWTGCLAGWAARACWQASTRATCRRCRWSRAGWSSGRPPAAGIPRVAESGVASAADARRVAEAGYDLALVGSALMSGNDPGALAGAMLSAARAARAQRNYQVSDTMWIKICGITTAEAVEAALAARVDAIGFVFADSPRQLTLEDAVALAAPARGRARCVAVTRHPSQRHLDDVLAVFNPDMLQTDTEDLQALRLPQQLELLPVFRGWRAAAGQASRATAVRGPDERQWYTVRLDYRAAGGAPDSARAGRRPRCRECADGDQRGSALRRRRFERGGGAAGREEPGRGGAVRGRRAQRLRDDPTGATVRVSVNAANDPIADLISGRFPDVARPLRAVRRPLCARDADSGAGSSGAGSAAAPAWRAPSNRSWRRS